MFQIVLQAPTEAAVVINRFDVEVRRRGEPIDGVEVVCPTAGAELNPRRIQVDLDADPPTVTYLRIEGDTAVPANLRITVSQSDPEVLEVWADTEECDCEWIGILSYVADGQPGTLEITNNGDVFRTSGEDNAVSYVWLEDAWVLFGG